MFLILTSNRWMGGRLFNDREQEGGRALSLIKISEQKAIDSTSEKAEHLVEDRHHGLVF